ncbi:MAG: hypothetical protein IT306_15955 [Chloroflexi bacterium]|nr:hypothetical protein [Chloroflexota bacterium]
MSEGNGVSRLLASTAYRVEIGERTVTVTVVDREDGRYVRLDEGDEQRIDVLATTTDGELSVLVGGSVLRGLIGRQDDRVTMALDGQLVSALVLDERAARLASAAAGGRHRHVEAAVRAPMPGLVVSIPVDRGQVVTRGATLVVLSAMKMQNELTAPSDGMVSEILVSPGQTVDQNQVLVRLE